ncbi:MAG: 30S ribosomal protein S6 [Candidatus Marinimicrobia bacterium]|nr:30S ribosomal protein S6 [Candidatus Neomarinimicrobiota bacterium]OUW51041.1 MAG: 30S ribosomal protein S6 [bacterium TMED190]|tara:strand:- start:896 stop:1309 length:414 start_codon:yes stop_codon:yes gene_type:complete
MRYYETIYIVHPDFEDYRLDEIKSNVDKQIKKNCDEIINSYVWGKRRLAYDINKITYGTYIIVHYSVKKSFIEELNSWMKIQENILVHMTIRLEEPPTVKEYNKDSGSKSVELKNNVNNNEINGDNIKDKKELEVKE